MFVRQVFTLVLRLLHDQATMPEKRRTRGKAPSTSEADDDTKPKKRRVSLACDACRAAREKCDGVKPRCGACTTLNRTCSYTPASKKRGVQSGYLRTIELSLSWLLQHVPDAETSLHRLLQQTPPSSGTRALLGKGSSGRHLQEAWNQSQVRNAIETLLSAAPETGAESADDEPTPEPSRLRDSRDTTAPPFRQYAAAAVPRVNPESSHTSGQSVSTTLRLPSQWRSLLKAYESDIHCWLPIMELDVLYSQGASYGTNGVQIELYEDQSKMSRHAELWAALAVATFQNSPSAADSDPTCLSAAQTFHTALNLVPDECDMYDMSSVRAMLLHSIVFIGRGRALKASLLLGKISRILPMLHAMPRSRSTHQNGNGQVEAVHVARSFLDVLCSLSLSQQTVEAVGDTTFASSRALSELSKFGQMNRRSESIAHARTEMQPVRTLLQLHAFGAVLADACIDQPGRTRSISAGDLVSKLDPDFNFCNSLIPGAVATTTISASLVKLVFLTASMYLASHLRPALLPGFSETMESCLMHYGVNRMPPVVTLLLQILQKQGTADGFGNSDDGDWQLTMGKLQDVWNDSLSVSLSAPTADNTFVTNSQSIQGELRKTAERAQPTGGQLFSIASIDSLSPSIDTGIANVAGNGFAMQSRFNNQTSTPDSTSMPFGSELFTGLSSGNGSQVRPFFPDGTQKVQQFDCDALFADLGSIGYVDNAEMNAQLMTNLGFAPDCDLTEMFQSDYGL